MDWLFELLAKVFLAIFAVVGLVVLGWICIFAFAIYQRASRESESLPGAQSFGRKIIVELETHKAKSGEWPKSWCDLSEESLAKLRQEKPPECNRVSKCGICDSVGALNVREETGVPPNVSINMKDFYYRWDYSKQEWEGIAD